MGDPEVINTNTDTDTNTELNVEIDQETEDMANSESVSHSVWFRLSGYFRRWSLKNSLYKKDFAVLFNNKLSSRNLLNE